MRKSLPIVAVLVSIIILVLFSGVVQATATSNWLNGYGYRKSNVITPATGAGMGYTVQFTAYFGIGTDGGGTVYLNSKCRADFGDVRFTASDGLTQLSYWMESYTPSVSATFWVKVDDNLNTTASTVYIYYGNLGQTTTSNGDATFLFFDNFPGYSFNTVKWTGSAASVYVSGGLCTVASGVYAWGGIVSRATFGPGLRFRSSGQLQAATGRYDLLGLSSQVAPNGNFGAFHMSSGSPYVLWGTPSYPVNNAQAALNGAWHTYEIDWVNSYIKWFSDGSQVGVTTTNVPSASMGAYAAVYAPGAEVSMHWVFLAKYVDSEPAHGVWSAEEVYSSEWLTGWQYRASHVITSAAGSGAGYQVQITVYYGIGTDSGNVAYLNGHARTDFGDVRFTASDGIALLSYWLESCTPGVSATFWVKVAGDLSTSDQTVYLYYGNSAATTTSNGDATFLFFDNFPGSSFNTAKWTGGGVSVYVSGGVCTLASGSYAWGGIVSQATFGPGTRFRSSSQLQAAAGMYDLLGFSNQVVPNGNLGVFHMSSGSPYVLWGTPSHPGNGAQAALNGAWHIYESDWTSSYIRWFSDGSQVGSTTTNVPSTSMGAYAAVYSPGSWVSMHWVFLSKFVNTEPGHGAWVSEISFSSFNTPQEMYTISAADSPTLTYNVSQPNSFVVVVVMGGEWALQNVTSPAGFIQLEWLTGADDYESAYLAVNPAQAAGTYTVSCTNGYIGNSPDISMAAYIFAPGTYAYTYDIVTNSSGSTKFYFTWATLTLSSGYGYYIFGACDGNGPVLTNINSVDTINNPFSFSLIGHQSTESAYVSSGCSDIMLVGIGITKIGP